MSNPNFESKVLRVLKAQRKTPVSLRELAKKAGVKKSTHAQFIELIAQMKQQNRIIEKNGKLLFCENLGLISARIVKVNSTFGFATPDVPFEKALAGKDMFIPGRKLAGAMPGDRVLVRILHGTGELLEGDVYKITEEAHIRFSAVLKIQPDRLALALPDQYVKFPMLVHPTHLGGAKDGDKVLCEIVYRGSRHSEHRARVVTTYGHVDSAAACCKVILDAHGIAEEFPPAVLEQVQTIAERREIHPKELAVRMDLRDQCIFTIDGADSKDLDDAVSLIRNENGWELGVHIADVSYYVSHQSPLDKEAFSRGTSVYYASSVIPMLPPELSNGVCSLNPGEDRLTFSARIQLDPTGKMLSHQFVKTVIRSRVKGIYSEINALLDGSADALIQEKYAEMHDALLDMKALADLLRERRKERGSIELASTESKLVLDAHGRCIDVQPRERGLAENIIEEFMLMANQAAATFALEEDLPFIYRVHENPAPDRISKLYDVLDQLGIKAVRPKDGITTLALGKILEKVAGTPADPVINTLVLHSMAKAKYSNRCTGHFGLSIHNYTHFTSPIRRYPDLTIHRILSGHITGMKKMNLEKRFNPFVSQAAMQSSEREIAAMTAERNCEACYKAEYMQQHLGETLEGIITSITAFGLYVRLPNMVEGLVSLAHFPDGDWSANGNLAFIERQTGKELVLGQPVRVQAAGAEISSGHIDFQLMP